MVSILDSFEDKFQRVLQHFTDDLKTVKTGRAKPSLVEDVKIEAYSSKMTLKELASISAPEPHQLLISPWDKNLVETIAKGINSAGANLNAVIDGDIVRIKIPPLTEETREELVKLVGQKLESAKVMLRQIRNELKREIEEQEGKPGIGEDDIKRELDEMQEKIDKVEEQLESLAKGKENELRKI